MKKLIIRSAIAAMCFATFAVPAFAASAKSAITESEAKEIALNNESFRAEDVTFGKVIIDMDEGSPEYELTFAIGNAKYEYDINAKTGEITSIERDVALDNTLPKKEQALTEDEAFKAALDHAGLEKKDLTEYFIEKDSEDGNEVYEIYLEKEDSEYNYTIAARTGQFLEMDFDIDK